MSRMELESEASLPGDSDRVLLLLEPGRDRELFAERLDDYEVLIHDTEGPLPEFDLCLVDMSTYPSVREVLAERKEAMSIYLPVLLVLGPDEGEAAVREAVDIADDVLSLPTTGVVFRNRVESLLRARRQSLQLGAQRERFRSLAESAPSPIVTIDPDGVIQYANAAVEQVFGFDPAELRGEPLTTLMPERFHAAHRAGLERYVRTGERQFEWTGIRFQGRHADGHEVPLLVSFAEYRVGGERRFIGTMQDVTEQVEREAELERTVDLLDRTQAIATVGGWEIDTEDLSVTWTDEVYEILGLPVTEEPSLAEAFEVYHPEDQPVIEAAVETALAEGESFDEEVRIVRPDDEVRWVRVLGEPETADGAVETLRGTFQDITERKERQRELERTVDMLDRAERIADVGGWQYDPETEELLWTEQTYRIIGVDEGYEPDPETDFEFLHPEDRAAVRSAFERAIEAGEPYDLEARIVRPDGEERWVRVIGEPETVDGRRVVRGAFGDITERKQREQERERLLELFEKVQDLATIGAWEYDIETDEAYWSEAIYDIYGLDPDEAEPDPALTLQAHRPADRERLEAAAEEAMATGEPYDQRVPMDTDDGTRWLHVHGVPRYEDGEVVGLYGTTQDITERVEREQELERTVEQLRQTRDIADVSGWEYDPETAELWWDEKVYDIYGREESFEPTAESVLALYVPDDRERMAEAMRRAIVEFEPFDIEIELDTDPTRWVRVTATPRVEDGRTTLIRGVTRDVTEQKRREQFLRRYERIVETASDPVYTLDPGFRFTLVNGALARLFDREQEALLGESAATVFGERHAEALREATARLMETDRSETTVETVITDAAGSERRYQTIISRKPTADGFDGIVCVSHDITDLTEHERRISVLDRVLRHNLRNKMNVVLARAASIRQQAERDEVIDAAAGVESAAEELLSLGEAARQFHSTLDPGAADLVEPRNVAKHAAHVVEEARLSYPDAVIEADLPDEAWAQTHQELELALSELVDNATTHGGPGTTVTVTVTEADGDVVVQVADDGPGIPDLEREAISAGLESPLQHATGLGLWFVRWTVTNSGGVMTIEDREGGGAVVELRLPAAAPPAE